MENAMNKAEFAQLLRDTASALEEEGDAVKELAWTVSDLRIALVNARNYLAAMGGVGTKQRAKLMEEIDAALKRSRQ